MSDESSPSNAVRRAVPSVNQRSTAQAQCSVHLHVALEALAQRGADAAQQARHAPHGSGRLRQRLPWHVLRLHPHKRDACQVGEMSIKGADDAKSA